ncbi:MAG TPA: hypothetical protein VN847_26145 [Streptosporangiaceae bacterium]|nr:hypothetical protein [Streptosporangiaceae bacterium]
MSAPFVHVLLSLRGQRFLSLGALVGCLAALRGFGLFGGSGPTASFLLFCSLRCRLGVLFRFLRCRLGVLGGFGLAVRFFLECVLAGGFT